MKEQIDLIKQDLRLIDKYNGTDKFDGLINDIFLHLYTLEKLYEKEVKNK